MTHTSVLARVIIAIAAVSAAFALRFALSESLTHAPFLVFIFAVTISAWYGGWWPGFAATVASLLIGNYFFSHPLRSLRVYDQAEFVMSLVFVGEGVLISWFSSRRLAALRRSHEAAERLRYLAWELTITEQRQRRDFAQALHDHLQQLLVAARMKLQLLRKAPSVDQQRLAEAEDLLQESLTYTRTMTAELSPSVLYSTGLVPAIRTLADQFAARHHLQIDVVADAETDRLDENGRVLMFQAVRELLFNVTKHAGVDRATVTVSSTDHAVKVSVEDHGRGYDVNAVVQNPPAQGGFGLFSIRERFRAVGGSATFDSSPGKGTRVFLFLPISAT